MKREVTCERREQSNTEIRHEDSLKYRQLAFSRQNHNTYIKQIELSAPDSFNRQHIRAITELHSMDNQQQGIYSTMNQETVHRIQTNSESKTNSKSREETGKNYLPLCIVFLVLGVIIILFYRK